MPPRHGSWFDCFACWLSQLFDRMDGWFLMSDADYDGLDREECALFVNSLHPSRHDDDDDSDDGYDSDDAPPPLPAHLAPKTASTMA